VAIWQESLETLVYYKKNRSRRSYLHCWRSYCFVLMRWSSWSLCNGRLTNEFISLEEFGNVAEHSSDF